MSRVRSEVSFYANVASFPTVGTQYQLYVDISTGIIYYWNGAAYATSSDGDAPINNPTFTGTVTTPIIKITTGASDRKVLTCDANWLASWQPTQNVFNYFI